MSRQSRLDEIGHSIWHLYYLSMSIMHYVKLKDFAEGICLSVPGIMSTPRLHDLSALSTLRKILPRDIVVLYEEHDLHAIINHVV